MVTRNTPGTLKVTTRVELPLLDKTDTAQDHGVDITNVFEIANVREVVHRTVGVSTTETGLVAFAANEFDVVPGVKTVNHYACGILDVNEVVYLQITNKDDAGEVTLRLRTASNAEVVLTLEHGQTFIFGCHEATGAVAVMDASNAAIGAPTLEDLADITADASAGDIDVEVLVALT